MFLAYNFCGQSCSEVVTSKEEIEKINIQNGIYDSMYGTANTNFTNDMNMTWDYNTRFFAKFQNSLMAGNVDYNAESVSSIKIKKRKSDEHNWHLIASIPITTNDSFNFELIDRFAQGKQEYYYSMTPMNNLVAGNSTSVSVKSDFDSFYLLDKTTSYHIVLNAKLNLDINKTTNTVSTLGRKYPFYISNGAINYKTGSLSFGLVPIINCEMNIDEGYKYRQQLEEWIMNGSPKILKDWTGQIFMINITDNISVSYDNYDMPIYTINFVEIGSVFNDEDMWINNFTDMEEGLGVNYE